MDRRLFLKSVSLLGAECFIVPQYVWSASSPKKILIMIELKGGNDGLNTFIPYTSNAYYALRPTIALAKESVLKIDHEFALHPKLKFLHQLYQSKQLAVIEGLGYANPNLSHFSSIDVWNTASLSSNSVGSEGWLVKCLKEKYSQPSSKDAWVLGDADLGPLVSTSYTPIVLQNLGGRMQKQNSVSQNKALLNNSALQHVLNVQQESNAFLNQLNAGMKSEMRRKKNRSSGFMQSINALDTFFGNGMQAKLIKLTLSGFDTHAAQPGKHARLLETLDQGMQKIKITLEKHQLWPNALVCTYSEFGRRVKENKNKGTDHGTANVHFAMGGKVKGGRFGQSPSMLRLDKDNLIHTHSFHQYYAGIIEDHFKLNTKNLLGKDFQKIPFIKT
ncbi:MAG TPA: DUF1501 domain-containing protein [Oligoflexia bacterium]|nr:DUF1501 domain-containing protein [Oligoflexia bacterium]HMR25116.1 DUF1501 domain-containing protein [Oligoflexia bacterium]